jgi:hypothetical protein
MVSDPQHGSKEGLQPVVPGLHVDVFEEVIDPFIGEDFHVKEINCGGERSGPADLLIQARGALFFKRVRVIPMKRRRSSLRSRSSHPARRLSGIEAAGSNGILTDPESREEEQGGGGGE